MISLERRDARKELGLGFGSGREMEDTELEEGEACSDHNNNDGDYDASMDPDIDLSYLDEKLQDVLGHFQKDFEGGVSAENLGAKFGGYGSFLPTYQRSPIWSHPRTPPKIQHHNAPKSPNNSEVEGGRRVLVSSSIAPQSVKPEPACATVVSLTASKSSSSSMITSAKQEVGMPSTNLAKEHIARYESVNRKSANIPDQKMLKVRIKVGSGNLSTQKNAAIYSGLGLDVSPSSSLDDSPSGSEGLSHGPQDSPFESPAHILQIMTSFPVHGGILLSPLPCDLIQLSEREKLHNGALPALTIGPESSGIIINGLESVRGDGKVLGEKKIKSLERNEVSAESKSENNRDFRSGVDALPKKELDLDTLACEELVSNTLKLPLLSNSYSVPDETKGTIRASNVPREVFKGGVRDKGFSDVIKEELLGPMYTHEDAWIENSKATSAGKIWEDKKASSFDSVSVYPRKDGHRKGEKPYGSVKSDSIISKGMKAVSSELTDTPKQKADQKVMSHEQEGTKFHSGKERLSSEGKKKLKGNQNRGNVVAEMLKDGLAGGSSLVTKIKKSASADDHTTKGELEDTKSQKNTGKAGDRYRDFFGDIELDREEKHMSPLAMSHEDRQKEFDLGEKSVCFSERSSGKKIDKLSTSEVHPKTATGIGSCSENGPISDAGPAATIPAATQDNWVCCDKCQTWRLLPLGKNPNDLPEKWLCSMLDWLPGMNRCSFSEAETTKAVMALNPVPHPLSQNNLQINPSGVISKVTLVDDQLDRTHQNFGLHTMPTGKKKAGNGPAPLSNSVKKGIQSSVANGSLNGVNQPMVGEPDFLKLCNSSDLAAEKHKYKQKEKHKALDSCSDGGDVRQLKMKGKRDSEQDLFRASKKMKTEGLPQDWISDQVNIEKLGPSSSNGLPSMSSEKNLPKKQGRTASKDQTQVSARKSKDEVLMSSDDVPTDIGKGDDREVGKKRKVKESHDSQRNPGSLSNILQDSRAIDKEEFSENEYRKKKKARVSRSDGKESSTSKGSGKTDKKASHRKNRQLGQDMGSSVSQRSLDGVDSLKRDSRSLPPSVAATSSSSKVSGSLKTKVNFHDTKGSPVESVSSSPLRVSIAGKLTSSQKNFTEKVDSTDAGFFPLGGRRRCSDGEDDGGSDRSGTAKKEKILDVLNHFNHASGGKAKQQIVPSPDVRNHHFENGGADYLGQDTRYPSKTTTSDRCRNDDRQHENHTNGSRQRKSGKVSSSRSKDKNKNLNSEFDNGKVKASDSVNEQPPSYEVKLKDGKNKIAEKFGVSSDEGENRYVDKKDSVGPLSSENSKKEGQSKFREHNGPDIKEHAISSHDTNPTPKKSLLLDGEATGRGKSPSLPPSAGAQNEMSSHCPRPVSGSHKENGANIPVNAFDNGNTSRTPKQIRKVDHPNGHQNSSRDPLSNGHRRDLDAPSPVKRDSSGQAATNALKEAKNLKHLADRLKNSGSSLESTRLYFEAALKFLHGASLLETGSSENAKMGEMIQSMQVYSSTAKLCEFCAHEYEKSKDMAAAALAYKCMEVAYMRVIYSSHSSANKDRNELHKALQVVPPGESPSSSASDLDNLNHPAAVDKGFPAKGISSPQVTGSHVIAARNRPSFLRLLNFAQDVNFAMEASRKSRIAFAAANVSLGETQRREGISSIKTALDFNFHDVEGLLRLIRLAIEASSR